MLKLRRLKINKYRLVKPGTELHFNDGFNILLGVNGTGKTTLLDLIAMIFSSNFSGLEEEEFNLDYEFWMPAGTLSVDVWNVRDKTEPAAPDEIAMERSMMGGNGQPSFSFGIKIAFVAGEDNREFAFWKKRMASAGDGSGECDARLAFTVVADRADVVIEGSGVKGSVTRRNSGDVSPFRPAWGFLNAFLYYCWTSLRFFRQTLAEVQGSSALFSQRFDESTFWIDQKLKDAVVHLVLGAGDIDPAFVGMNPTPYVPLDISINVQERVKRMRQVGEEPDSALTLDQEAVPLLQRFVDALKYRRAEAIVVLKDGEPQADRQNRPLFYGNIQLFFVKQDGARVGFDRLSYGQRRLVAFFYYLDCHQKVAILDELANGMHYAMIDHCLKAIGDRQAFLATQNPLLLDRLPFDFEDPEQVRRTFVLCESKMEGPREDMIWSHMSEDEAIEFFKDYQVGIQHTNDVLRTRGLW